MEEWIKWEPINGLAEKYFAKAIYSDNDGLEILLSNKKNQSNIRVLFEGFIASYRETYETFRLNSISVLDEKYKMEISSQWTFFKVTNSTYISWLSKESYEIIAGKEYIHFCFMTEESIIDVVAGYEPKVETIK